MVERGQLSGCFGSIAVGRGLALSIAVIGPSPQCFVILHPIARIKPSGAFDYFVTAKLNACSCKLVLINAANCWVAGVGSSPPR